MDKQNALAVGKFIIHADVDRTLNVLRSKCKREITSKRVRAIYSLVYIQSLALMFTGYVEVNLALIILSISVLCVLTVCIYSLADIHYSETSLSYRELKDAYDKISMTSFKDYNSMFNESGLKELLPGLRLMDILYEYQIHHVSITKDGNLAFIYEKDSIQVSSSFTVDTSQILNTYSKVNIIVDACYIKAVPT